MADSNLFKVSTSGAVGNGTTDDTAAVQQACDWAVASKSADGFCSVIFDVPVLRMNGSVTLSGSVALKSFGGTQIYGAGNIGFYGGAVPQFECEGLIFGGGTGAQSSNGFSQALHIETSNVDGSVHRIIRSKFMQSVAVGFNQGSYAASRSTITEITGSTFDCNTTGAKIYSDMLSARASRFIYRGQGGPVCVVDSLATFQDCMLLCATGYAAGGEHIAFYASDQIRQLHLRNCRASENSGILVVHSYAAPNVTYGGSDSPQTGVTLEGGYYDTVGAGTGRRCLLLCENGSVPNFSIMTAIAGSYQYDGLIKCVSGSTMPAVDSAVIAAGGDPWVPALDQTARNLQIRDPSAGYVDSVIRNR